MCGSGFSASAASDTPMKTLLLSLALYGAYAGSFFLALRWVLERSKPGAVPRTWVLGAALLACLHLVVAEPLRSPFEDFRNAYYSGGRAILEGQSWTALYSEGVHGFVNIPIVALLFVPFALLPPLVASLVYLAFGFVAVFATWKVLVQQLGRTPLQAQILALLFLTNGPLMNSLKEGNTSHFALFGMVWALVLLERGRPYWAGALLAFLAVFKLPLLLFAPWALLRGQFRFLGGAALFLLAFVGVSVGLFGLETHQLWYQSFVAGSARLPLGAFNVQSFPAAYLRLVDGARVMCNWEGIEVAAWVGRVSKGLSVLLVLLCVGAGALATRRETASSRPFEARAIEFSMVMLLACVASPLAWSHYYCWALLPLALWWGSEQSQTGGRYRRLWTGAFACLILPVVWPWCAPHGPFAVPYALLSSHFLFGAVLLLVLLAREYGSGRGLMANSEVSSH